MLEALRNAASSWVLKPLLILLVLAFIVWGVADVFTGARQGSLASVGSTEISVDEYQSTYGAVMNNLGRRFGRRPTAEEARLRGIDRAVLEDLINSAAVDQQVRSLGLTLSQSAVAKAIESDPSLQGPDGKFDRAGFENFLREIGYNERGYLSLRRREEIRQQLTQSLFQNIPVAGASAQLIHNWREETRTVQHFTVDPAGRVKLPEPTEAQLKETYDANQRAFVTPEYRHLALLVMTAADVKRDLDIKEDEIRAAYDQDKGAREVPERRRVQQIPFKDAAAAEAAAKAIAAGKSFMDAAKEAGATEADVDLGLIPRSGLIDATIGDAAFALDLNRVSQPVKGRFTTVLLRVTEIQPAKVRTFEEMRQEIRDKIADSRANEAIRKLHDTVDQGRGAGQALKEIAATLKAKLIEIPEVDQLGNTPGGSKAYDGTDAAKILRAAFAGQAGIEIDPVDLTDGGYAWVDVLGVKPEAQRPFDAVKDEVRKLWERLETAKQTTELAAKLVERADKGETLTALAKEVGATLQTSKPFKRFGTDSGLPAAAVQRAFGLQLGARAAVDTGSDGKRIVFRLVDITKPAPLTKEQTDQLTQQLRAELQQDAVQAYVMALRERFGVRVNEQLFKRTTGETTDQR
jgi:peptidyl-prolyl cis-trans isomerase D